MGVDAMLTITMAVDGVKCYKRNYICCVFIFGSSGVYLRTPFKQ